MKKILLWGSCMLLPVGVIFAQYKPVDNGSSVLFSIKNLGIRVNGTFKGLTGSISFNPQYPGQSSFDVSIDANTVNTDNSLRDEHLRNKTYFDVEHYKTIHFVSTKVVRSTMKDIFFVFGKLTIKDKTKDISFPFTAKAVGDGYLLKGKFGLNREDFGIGGTSTISDDLEVTLNILAKY